MDDRLVLSLLQPLERWSCHIWPRELNISCTSPTADSRAKIWYQLYALNLPPVDLAAVLSKAVPLLFLIRCWLLLPLLDSVIVLCLIAHYFVSILFYNHLDVEKRVDCFALFVFLVPRDWCVALPHDDRGLSEVCDCGISWSYPLNIFEPSSFFFYFVILFVFFLILCKNGYLNQA